MEQQQLYVLFESVKGWLLLYVNDQRLGRTNSNINDYVNLFSVVGKMFLINKFSVIKWLIIVAIQL